MTQQTAGAATVSSLTPRERLVLNLSGIIERATKGHKGESHPCVILSDGTTHALEASNIEGQLERLVDAHGGLGIRGAGCGEHWHEVSATIREALAREARKAGR